MPVQRVVQSLTHLRVVERRLADVQADQRITQIRHLGGHHAGHSGQRVDSDRIHRREQLVGAAGHASLARAGLRNDIEFEARKLGQPRHVVIRVFGQADVGVGHPLVELEWAGSDRDFLQFSGIRHRLGWHDSQRFKLPNQWHGGCIQVDDDIAVVGYDFLDHRQAAGIG